MRLRPGSYSGGPASVPGNGPTGDSIRDFSGGLGRLPNPEAHLHGSGSAGRVRDYFASLPADQFPNVVETVDEMFSGGPDERFELGLVVILRGLASYARP